MSRPNRGPAAPLLDNILDQLGKEVVAGILPEGRTFTLLDLSTRFEISRTVAREAMRALEQLGLVAASRRVGITVQPRSKWAAMNQSIIEWRLATESELHGQLQSLAELRAGVEPVAARLAAQHASHNERNRLVKMAHELSQLSTEGKGNSAEFLELDGAFHGLLLRASGNEMFAALVPAIISMLKGRTASGLMPAVPNQRARAAHVELANAVCHGEADAAEHWAKELLDEVFEHLPTPDPR